MAEQAKKISTGTMVGFTLVSLAVAVGYFLFLDYALMNMQGLDFFYLFRK
jgi:hypothetical protein